MSAWAPLPHHPLRVPQPLIKRVIVPPLPPRFNALVDGPIAMKHGVYLKAERILHELLLHSRASRATAAVPPTDALYFVPVYVSQIGSSRTSRLSELDAALAELQRVAPWPARSRQFLFAVALDRGRCFQEDGNDRFRDAMVLMYEGTCTYPRAPSKSQPLHGQVCHRRDRDVVIPPFTDLGARTRLVASLPELNVLSHAARHANASFPWSWFTHRNLLAAWRGSSTSSSGRTARTAWAGSHGGGGGEGEEHLDVRHALLGAFGHKPVPSNASAAEAKEAKAEAKAKAKAVRLAVREASPPPREPARRSAPGGGAAPTAERASSPAAAHPHPMPILISSRKLDKAAHYAELRRSLFCLAPSGWAQWTIRFFEAVHLGCIPVTFFPSPHNPSPLRRPFDDALDYAAFSVNVPPTQVAQALRPTLEAIAHNRTRLRAMQRALWEARPAFDWTDTSERGALFRTLQDVLARLGVATTGVNM